jgi:hypothetical protein
VIPRKNLAWDHYIGTPVANARSVYLNSFELEKNLTGGHTIIVADLGRKLKVVEHLGGERLCRESTTEVVEYFKRIYQVGIEPVQGVHR